MMRSLAQCCHLEVHNESCLGDWHASFDDATNQEYARFYRVAQFITGLVCYPILCVVGLTGNGITLFVLSRKKMVSSTNVYLCALAVADAIKLINDLLYFINQVLQITQPRAANEMVAWMYPISHYIQNGAVCISVWLTVSVAVECYINICHATRAKELCTISKARAVSILIFITMGLVALPSAFRYTSAECYDNSTLSATYKIVPSALGLNTRFITAYQWVQNLLRSVIPLLILIVLSGCIIQALRRERMKGKTLSARNRITLMLIIVIVVCLVCVTPDAVMSTIFGFGYVDENNLIKGVREITDSLLAVNSAVNFLVYSGCSRVFRLTYEECLCPPLAKRRRARMECDSQHIEQSTFTKSDRRSSSSNNFNNVAVYIGPQGPQSFV